MYKHIVRDKRHSTFNQSGGDEVAQYNMDSMVDISDAASHRFKNVDSRLGPSRQGHTLNYSGKKRALQDLLALTTKRITILAEDSFL